MLSSTLRGETQQRLQASRVVSVWVRLSDSIDYASVWITVITFPWPAALERTSSKLDVAKDVEGCSRYKRDGDLMFSYSSARRMFTMVASRSHLRVVGSRRWFPFCVTGLICEEVPSLNPCLPWVRAMTPPTSPTRDVSHLRRLRQLRTRRWPFFLARFGKESLNIPLVEARFRTRFV